MENEPTNYYILLCVQGETGRNYRETGAGAGEDSGASATAFSLVTGPDATTPLLTSSAMARRGLLLCLSHRSGKYTPINLSISKVELDGREFNLLWKILDKERIIINKKVIYSLPSPAAKLK